MYSKGDQRRERAARVTVLDVPQFPDLEKRLIRVYGPSAPAIFLHQLLYWLRKPKYRDAEPSGCWIYKTAAEWQDERGLSRTQVDRARKVLAAAGVLEEKHGRGFRIYYRVNWVRLAETLDLGFSLRTKGVQAELAQPENGDGPHRQAEKPSENGSETVQASSHIKGIEAHSREYAREFEQEKTSAEVRKSVERGPAPPQAVGLDQEEDFHEIDVPAGFAGRTLQQEVGEEKTIGDLRSGNAAPAPGLSRLDGQRKHALWALMSGDRGENRVHGLTALHLEGGEDHNGTTITLERIAQEGRELLGGDEPLGAYTREVGRWVEHAREVAL